MQIAHTLAPTADYDVVVIGAGGAGMATALFAALAGARVLLVESTALVGGTTAWSAGTTWVPGNPHSARVNPQDSLADAAHYLNLAVGERSPAALRQAFLDHGAAAIAALEANTEVNFRAYPKHPDYISDLPGATLCGRALEPLPFDGRRLGALLGLVRPPIPEFTVLGGMMVDRTDINHLLAMGRSWASFKHALRLIVRHARDRLRHPRGTRLVMGNAVVARLLASLAAQPHVTLALQTEVQALHRDANGVTDLTLHKDGQACQVTVHGGVVLASGGFNRHAGLRQALLPGVDAAWCPGAPGHTGSAHDLARGLGAAYGSTSATPAFWAPVSRRPRADGSQAVFPHFVMDRAKPGVLAVNQAGQRFVNESTSYHLFALAMQAVNASGASAVPAYLVCDARALRAYGLGMVRPGGRGLQAYLQDGYLVQGQTLANLAQRLGLPAPALQATVARFNQHASDGQDPDFQRGSTAYQRNLGDANWPGSNPCLGPLTEAPFYAVRLYPGDIGAATGFATDTEARVLDAQQQPIEGLYAVGNDMQSIMGGVYTAPGITLGPGLVFGYLAARHARARAG